MTTPKPASPELLKAVKNQIYEEVWNEDNPPEQSTQLEKAGEHRVWKHRQHLLDGLAVRDFQVLVDKRLDEETKELANAWKRIQELRAAAHPKALEMKS